VRLLLEEMYPAAIAEQLRARGFDVVSIHEPSCPHLEGAADEDVFAAAVALERALVTENVPDYRRLEAAALASGAAHPRLVFTTNRRFPRGHPGTTGRLVLALAALLAGATEMAHTTFLQEPGERAS
jgi:Domain of unknown function (DUF5615)